MHIMKKTIQENIQYKAFLSFANRLSVYIAANQFCFSL